MHSLGLHVRYRAAETDSAPQAATPVRSMPKIARLALVLEHATHLRAVR